MQDLIDYYDPDIDLISKHRLLTIDIILELDHLPWNWKLISSNENIKKKDIKNNPNLPWDKDGMLANYNLNNSLDEVKDYYLFSKHPRALELAIKYPYEKWNWISIAINSNINSSLLRKCRNKQFWSMLPKNKNGLSVEIIDEFKDKFNWKVLSKFINVQKIKNPFKYPLDPNKFSTNTTITIEIVKSNPSFLWNWDELTKNRGITIGDMLKNKGDMPFNTDLYSLNPSISCYEIENFSINWNWAQLSMSNYINELVNKYPDKNWNWNGMIMNKHLSIETVLKFKKKKRWNKYYLAMNQFLGDAAAKRMEDITSIDSSFLNN